MERFPRSDRQRIDPIGAVFWNLLEPKASDYRLSFPGNVPLVHTSNRMKKSGASLVAASFIGYLIDSYGWPTAKRFICARHANPQNAFAKTFGLTLANAEQNWRKWLKHYSCDAQQN